MDKMDQLRIVQEITDQLRDEMIKEVPDMPDERGDVEIRQWAVDLLSDDLAVNIKDSVG